LRNLFTYFEQRNQLKDLDFFPGLIQSRLGNGIDARLAGAEIEKQIDDLTQQGGEVDLGKEEGGVANTGEREGNEQLGP
jgi:hypothetical protein